MRTQSQQRGFSLVEVMIGLVLGMLSVVLVLQAFGRSNAAVRVAATSDDAQLNANMALHILSREIRQAGLNLSSLNLLGCSLSYKPSSGSSVVSLDVGPVQINPDTVAAGDSHTDTLLMLSGNYAGTPEGDEASISGSALTVATEAAFAVGNYVVLAAGSAASPCQLALYQVTTKSGNDLTVTDLSGGVTSTSTERAYNLGSAPRFRAYAIRSGALTECDYLVQDCASSSNTSKADVWVPVAPQVVSLRSQYAHSNSVTSSLVSLVADEYDQVTPGSSTDTSSLALHCRWAHLMGLRLAVVGRGLLMDRDAPTADAPTWAGSDDAAVDLSGLTNWQQFRYRLMETAMPLRNILWQGASSCS